MEIEFDPVEANKLSLFAVTKELLQLERNKLSLGLTTSKSFQMFESRLAKHVIPWFSGYELEKINYKIIEKFIAHLQNHGLSPVTITQYLNALRKVLKHALHQGYLDLLPSFPCIKNNSTPRGGFPLHEYKLLFKSANTLSKSNYKRTNLCLFNDENFKLASNHRRTAGGIFTNTPYVCDELAGLIRFMVNTFVRPVDIKIIKHEHIQIVRGQHTYLRLSLPVTKNHRTQIISMPAAVKLYESLLAKSKENGYGRASDYVFLPEIEDREAAIYLISKDFRKVLNHTGLRYGTQGQGKSLYSLRHTAITFRLLYGHGIDLLTLAKNARTSVEMIERFYASELSAEMNVSMLHSRRPNRHQKYINRSIYD
jgi:site-specific recombinase XerD